MKELAVFINQSGGVPVYEQKYEYIKIEIKIACLTQEDFAIRSGLGLRFVRELEQGKETVRLDKVNQALAMFGKEAVPGKKEE